MNFDRLLVKAKAIHNGEWVYGHYIARKMITGNGTPSLIHKISPIANKQYIGMTIPTIDPNTICQCTGLKDKNGELIFEGDVIGYESDINDKRVVAWIDGNYCLDVKGHYHPVYGRSFKYRHVIGNIHDKEGE